MQQALCSVPHPASGEQYGHIALEPSGRRGALLTFDSPYFPIGSASAQCPVPAPGSLAPSFFPIPLVTPIWCGVRLLKSLTWHTFECNIDPVPLPQHSYRTTVLIIYQKENIWGMWLAAMSFSAMVAQCKTHVYANLKHTSPEHNRTQPQHPEHEQKATKMKYIWTTTALWVLDIKLPLVIAPPIAHSYSSSHYNIILS